MKTEDHIIDLLKDDSFPPMLMLDGGWGSGKTYFVKNTLMERLKKCFPESKVDYLSLYGLESVNDFRDKIISLLLTKTKNGFSYGTNLNKFVGSIAKFSGEKGIGGIIGGVSGAVKHKMLASVKNRIFIFDDLERVSNKALIDGILGEAFNFAEQHTNVKVLVVANSEKISCKESLEKVFVDKVPFVFSYDDILDVVKPQFSTVLDDNLVELLKNTIKDLELKNIRVIKRALTRFKLLVSDIGDESVITDVVYPILLEQIIRVCHANLSKGYSEDEINDFDGYRLNRHINEECRDDKKEALCEILAGQDFDLLERLLVKFCCTGRYEFRDVVEDLKLPKSNDLLSNMISIQHQYLLGEEEFVEGVKLLQDYIHSDEALDIHKWVRACDTYIYMIDQKVIEENGFTRQGIVEMMREKQHSSFEIPDIAQAGTISLAFKPENNDVHEIYKSKLDEFVSSIGSVRVENLKGRFSNSWASIDVEVYNDWRLKPLLNILGVKCILKALESWSVFELNYFVDGIRTRYKLSNIKNYYLEESETISELISGVSILLDKQRFGRKRPLLQELKNELCSIKDRLESSN